MMKGKTKNISLMDSERTVFIFTSHDFRILYINYTGKIELMRVSNHDVKITVTMHAYSVLKFIEEAVESVLCQNYEPNCPSSYRF